MGLLDLTGPLTVFWSAPKFMEQQGLRGYVRHTVSLDGGPILTAELAAHAPRARRTASLCAGAFLLAEAGLLRGHRVMTHWASCDLLNQRYGDLTVEPDAIYVHAGPIWASAGGSAGMDLTLALVQEECGRWRKLRPLVRDFI